MLANIPRSCRLEVARPEGEWVPRKGSSPVLNGSRQPSNRSATTRNRRGLYGFMSTARSSEPCRCTRFQGAMSTYHDILGVNPDASQEEIKSAFRRRALECHPDQADEGEKEAAQEEFLRVREAFEILSDTENGHWSNGSDTASEEDSSSRSRGRRRSYKERWRNAKKVRVSKDIVDRVQGLSGEYRNVRRKTKITVPVCAVLTMLVFLFDPLMMHGTGIFLVDFLLCGLVGSVYGFVLGSIWAYGEIFLGGDGR
jgi:hypothetical protein